jgi:hypothetical protein
MENYQTYQSDTSFELRRNNSQWKCVYLLYTLEIKISTPKSKTFYSPLLFTYARDVSMIRRCKKELGQI